MKKYLLLLLLCPLPLVTCVNSKDTVRTLNLAEELMSSRPDSSLALLITIHPGRQDSRQAHARYALLRTMALDKNYIDVADDSLARVAYDYFQRHGSKDYRMKSSYYLGVVKENAEELIDAAILFKEAEGLAEELKDYHFLGLSRQHLSGIFAKNYDHNEALEYALKAEKAFSEAGENLSARYAGIEAAKHYRLLEDYLRAESKLDSLLSSPSPSEIQLGYLFSQKGELSFIAKQFDIANNFLLKAQEHGYSLSKAILGDYAVTEEWLGHPNKADSLLRILQSKTYTQIDSITFFNALHNILFLRQDFINAYEAMITATKLQDKTVITLLERSITHSFKSYYENHFKIEKEKAVSRLFIILLISVISFFLLVFFFSRIRKKNRQLMNDMSLIDDIKVELGSLQERNKGLNTVIHSMMENRIDSMQHLAETYFQWSDEMVSQRENKEGKILKEDAIAQFRQQLQQLRNDKQFIADIENALNNSHDGVIKRLRSNNTLLGGHALKEIDFNLLVLLFSGFSIKSISFLMNMTEQSIRTRKTRYKKKFQEKDDADSLLFTQWLS